MFEKLLFRAFSAEVEPGIGAMVLIRGANPLDFNGLISDNYLPVNLFVASSMTGRHAAPREDEVDRLEGRLSIIAPSKLPSHLVRAAVRADGEINRARGSIDEVVLTR